MDHEETDVANFIAEVGRRLAHHRKERGLSLQAVAKHLDMSKAAVGHWETGTNPIDIGKLRRLARLYGTTVVSLVAERLSKEDFMALTARQLETSEAPASAARGKRAAARA